MKKELYQAKIVVKKSPLLKSYGVFAAQSFKKGDIIEECYVLISRGGDKKLEDYYFDVNGKSGIFLGYGMIYNHSEDPNATYRLAPKRHLATFVATRAIKKGEEIFVTYGDGWFADRHMKIK